jgi:hypothetical protein
VAKPIVSIVLTRIYGEDRCEGSAAWAWRQIPPDFEVVELEAQASTAVALNEATRRASGEYVAFAGSGREWAQATRKLEKQVAALVATPALNWCYATGEEPLSGDILRPLLVANFIPAGSVMVRRSTLQEAGGFDETEACRFSEEWELWLRLAAEHAIAGIFEPSLPCEPSSAPIEQVFEGKKRVVEAVVSRHEERLKDLRSEALAEICISAGNAYLLEGKRTEARDKFAEALTHIPLRSDAYLSWISSYLSSESQQQMRDLNNLARRIQPSGKSAARLSVRR